MNILNVIAGEKRVDEVELRTITIIGTMGSGKTTLARHLASRGYRELTQRGVDDSRILIVHFYRSSITAILNYLTENFDLEDIEFLYLINDDAAYMNMSRRAMNDININDARQYIVIRHKLAENNFKGVLIAVHLTQLYYLLDKVLRDSQVLMFKSMSRDNNERKYLATLLGRHYFRVLRKISDDIAYGNKDRYIEALSRAVAVVGSRRLIYEFKKEDPPRNIYYEVSPEEINIEPKITLNTLRDFVRGCGIQAKDTKIYRLYKLINAYLNGLDVDMLLQEIQEEVEAHA